MPRAKSPRAYPREFFAILERVGEQGGEVTVPLADRLLAMKLAGKYWAFRGALKGSVKQAQVIRDKIAQETKALGKAITTLDPELEREEELSRIADQVIAQVKNDGVTFCRTSETWQSKAMRAALEAAGVVVGAKPEAAADESEKALLAKLAGGKP